MAAMTSGNNKMKFPCWVIGLMSGTSADGVDAALVYTDGKDILEVGGALTMPYSDALRGAILGLMKGAGNLKEIEQALTLRHIEAIDKLRAMTKDPIKLIGFHGQTIKHAPKQGITRQIGDARLMTQKTGLPVIADFRSNDVRQGGQGAPLVPLFHAALAKKLPKPLMVVNIGGVANVTWLGAGDEIIAFDCGPGNALIDDWLNMHTKARFDEEGRMAAAGKSDSKRMAEFLNDPFFSLAAPKSLDRQHFSLKLVEGLSPQDGAATLTAMTASAIAKACELVPEAPKQLLVTGGGRHNSTLMSMIGTYSQKQAVPVEDVDWNGDALEAQAFGYLAARSIQGLALTLPSTTGVTRPVTGGVFYPALRAVGS